MRTVIKAVNGGVELTYYDIYVDEVITKTFYSNGHYVFDSNDKQICDGIWDAALHCALQIKKI